VAPVSQSGSPVSRTTQPASATSAPAPTIRASAGSSVGMRGRGSCLYRRHRTDVSNSQNPLSFTDPSGRATLGACADLTFPFLWFAAIPIQGCVVVSTSGQFGATFTGGPGAGGATRGGSLAPGSAGAGVGDLGIKRGLHRGSWRAVHERRGFCNLRRRCPRRGLLGHESV
jgi:hypothetical protein